MKNSPLRLLLPILCIYLIIQISYFLFYSPPSFVLPLTWDKLGYYLYLPSAFIYHDMLHLGFIPEMMQKYELSGYFYQAHIGQTGNYVFSYTLGLAILELPFFFLGHLAAHVFGYPADGFSMPYQFCITLGGTFYSMIGIWYLYRVLRHFFTETISAITLLIIVFSTNYFYFSVFENGMTHTYLFTLYAAVLYYTIHWHRDHYMPQAVKLGFAMGLAILIRPSEILIVLIPLLWGISDKPLAVAKFHLLLRYYGQMLVMCIIMIPIALLQIIYWKYSSGHWLYNSYSETGQHFDFGHPHILQGLFSIRKGWFIYTPVILLPLFGLTMLYKYAKGSALSIWIFTLLNVYVVFSWSMWYYGGSFGCRALVQSYAVFAIPLGCLIQYVGSKKHLRLCVVIFVILATLLNLFQTMQYAKGMLSTEGLSLYTYRLLFGKTSISVDDIKRFEKLEVIKGPFAFVDTLAIEKFDSSHYLSKPLLLTKEVFTIYDGAVNQEKGKYIRISARGKFDHIEYGYGNLPAMRLVFWDKDSIVICEKLIKIEPLMCAHEHMNVDYLGDPDTWTNFNFIVKRPPNNSRISLSAFNPGYNQTLIDHLVVENIAE